MLYGRGAADMKTSLAAFVTAIEVSSSPIPAIRLIALLLTSDEEGDARDGTIKVVEGARSPRRAARLLHRRRTDVGQHPGRHDQEWRRGSLSGKLTVKGRAGPYRLSASCPQPGSTCSHPRWPNWQRCAGTKGSEYFPPTSWQVPEHPRRHRGQQCHPGSVEMLFTFACASAHRRQPKKQVHAILDRNAVNYELNGTSREIPSPRAAPS